MAQHLPLNQLILTSAQEKFKGKPTLIHHHVLENNLDQHFPQTGRSHDRDMAKSMSFNKKFVLFLRKLAHLYVINRMRKHPSYFWFLKISFIGSLI